MRHTISTQAARCAILLLLVLVSMLGASCGDGDTPAGPTSVTPPSQSVVQSIRIDGTTTLQNPGDVAHLTAIATYSDGTTQNVTAQANWSADHSEIVSVMAGLLTARGYGQCHVTASYGVASARVRVRVLPEGMFILSGRVTDETGLPLQFIRVAITSPNSMSTTTNREGVYSLAARGETEIKAEVDGFETQVQRLTVASDQTLDFRLKITSRGFGGMYRLIFVASTSCELPSDAMRRTWLARVEERSPNSLIVAVSGAEFVAWGNVGFVGRRDGSSVRFDITSDYSADYVLVELLDPGRELAFLGTAVGEAGDRFVTRFEGTVTLKQRGGQTIALCQAADHRLEFTR